MARRIDEETNSGYCLPSVSTDESEERQNNELHWMIQYYTIKMVSIFKDTIKNETIVIQIVYIQNEERLLKKGKVARAPEA